MQKTYTVNFLSHQTKRNKGKMEIYYETDHHEPIVTREEHARSLLLLNSDHHSPFLDHEYEIKVIKKGLLAGFIPLNLAFGGYDAGHYLGALVMADIPQKNIEAEIAHIAGTRRVRRELFSEWSASTLTISKNDISFNSACISLFQDTAYVEILLHPNERIIAVRKTTNRNKKAVPWRSGALPSKKVCHILYSLMGWQMEWKYKMTADYFSKNDEQLIMFDLNCCEFRIRDTEKGSKAVRAIPSEWLSCFGDGLPEYIMMCRRALAEHLEKWDINAASVQMPYFAWGIKALSRAEAEQRIEEMRAANG
jgi:hypothetical protein